MKSFICGFSGSGKSTKLKELEKLEKYKGYVFIDLDDHILKTYAPDLEDLGLLIEQNGFEWFREVEKEQLLKLFKENSHIWVALGGGTLDEKLVTLLSEAQDIQGFWLDVDFSECWSRIKEDRTRPLVKLGEEKLREIYQNRLKFFKNYKKMNI